MLLAPRDANRLQETAIAVSNSHRDITVIGGSAGAIAPLKALLAALPADYPAAVFIVIHTAADAPPMAHHVFARASTLPVVMATAGMAIRPGQVAIAPPDAHLVLRGNVVQLSYGPRENRHRPSIDVLFRSAAVAYGPRVTGVVLSGMMDDGAAGLWAIQTRGGATVVQHPEDAEYAHMPASALERLDPRYCVPMNAMPQALVALAREPVGTGWVADSRTLELEVAMAADNQSEMAQLDAMGPRAPYSCPQCGGALWQVGEPAPRFRCHVGHAYSPTTLATEQAERIEAALWAGLRGLEERERLARQLADAAAQRGDGRAASYHHEAGLASASHAEALRGLLAANARMNRERAWGHEPQ